jgi:hypothetical protein
MFNATELRMRAKHGPRLDSYFKRNGFNAVLNGLVKDGFSEEKIMKTTRGPGGCTMLHNAFMIDFAQWLGGEVYYKAIRKYVRYPLRSEEK